MERNTIVVADALQWCRSLEAGSVDVWWASPPYNLADPFRGGNSVETKVRGLYAGGARKPLPEPVYQQEQVEVLAEWHRTLAPGGVAFYNHKVRIKDGRAISPLEWIYKTPFVLLQEVVWDRGGTANVDTRRYLPVSERVYVLAREPGLQLDNRNRLPDVWHFPPNHHKRAKSGHPCPTHPGVVASCLTVVPRPEGRTLLVADSYAGSGTTAHVATQMGMDYIGCDRAAPYVRLAQERLSQSPVQLTYHSDESASMRQPVLAVGASHV